jgi:hypothetical protein
MRPPLPAALDGNSLALLAGIAGGCALFVKGFAVWRRERTVEDTPASRVRSMALGRVALQGKAVPWVSDLVAPLSGAPCCWYRYQVEEERRSGRSRSWHTIAHGDSAAFGFYLEDETGRVLVQPEGAELVLEPDLSLTRPDLDGPLGARLAVLGVDTTTLLGLRRTLRVTEWRLVQGDPVYVLGVAQERPSLAGERRASLAERIGALKHDPAAMARLDTDGDGQVSPEEWDVARRAIVSEVTTAPVEDRVVVARAPNGESPFVLADRAEPALARTLRWRAWGSVVGGAALAVVCLGLLLARHGF